MLVWFSHCLQFYLIHRLLDCTFYIFRLLVFACNTVIFVFIWSCPCMYLFGGCHCPCFFCQKLKSKSEHRSRFLSCWFHSVHVNVLMLFKYVWLHCWNIVCQVFLLSSLIHVGSMINQMKNDAQFSNWDRHTWRWFRIDLAGKLGCLNGICRLI